MDCLLCNSAIVQLTSARGQAGSPFLDCWSRKQCTVGSESPPVLELCFGAVGDAASGMLCSISSFAISAMGLLMTACLRLVRSAAVFRTIRTGSASKQPAESKILSLQEINGTGSCQGPRLHCRGPDISSIVCSCGLVDGLIFALTEQWRGGGHICKEHKLLEASMFA